MDNRQRTDLEGPIHRSIYSYLRVKYPRALIFHPANEMNLRGDRTSKAIAQAKAKALGMLPGAPDLIMLHGGLFYGFEVKSERGRQTESQRLVGDVIRANGGCYAVVRSIDDAAEAIEEFEAREGFVTLELRGIIT